MITFKEYLSEGLVKSAPITPEEAVEWCKTHASKFIANKQKIFRGMNIDSKIGIFDTNLLNRTSANTYNYYTVWMDNNNKWKQYPKRSKSYVCTPDWGVARGFGDIHLIIPEDGAKIGICSSHDLWDSFEFCLSRAGLTSLDRLMDDFNRMFKLILPSGFMSGAAANYSDLLKCLKAVTLEKLTRYNAENHKNSENNCTVKWAERLKKFNYDSLLDFMIDTFDPEENDFKVKSASNIGKLNDVEIWVQGKVLQVTENAAYLNKNVFCDYIRANLGTI